jgi:hypothetical protein
MASFGIISNSGNLSFIDYDGRILNFAKSLKLNSKAKINIDLTDTISKATTQIGDFFAGKWNYDNNSSNVSVSLVDGLQKMRDINIVPLVFNPQTENAEYQTADKLYEYLANTDKYGLRYKYFSPKGSLVYDVSVSNSEIKRLISQGYYTTKRADFLEIIAIFNKLLPKIEFFDGVKFRKCSLSADGKTLHLDLRFYGGDTVESLAELTKHMRGQIINVMLPKMLDDCPVLLAMLNQMNISFNHTSDDVASWNLDILIKPNDYKSLLTQQSK